MFLSGHFRRDINHWQSRRWRFITALILSLGFTTAHADIGPFYTFDQSPLTQFYGAPAIGEATLVRKNRTRAHIVFDISSNFVNKSRSGERIFMDLENYRSTLMLRHGLSEKFEIGLDLPYVVQSAGVLDDVIDEWHNLFGFPDGGRHKVPKNQYQFFITRDRQDVLRVITPPRGVGDVRLSMGVQLYRGVDIPRRSLAFRASTTYATGRSDRLLGSDTSSFALALHMHEKHVSGSRHWAWFGNLGAIKPGESVFLKDLQRQWAHHGSIGFGWYPWSQLILKAQFEFHSPYYKKSRLRQLNTTAGQLVFGGTLRLMRKFNLDIGVAEDVLVRTVSDVNFHIRLSKDL